MGGCLPRQPSAALRAPSLPAAGDERGASLRSPDRPRPRSGAPARVPFGSQQPSEARSAGFQVTGWRLRGLLSCPFSGCSPSPHRHSPAIRISSTCRTSAWLARLASGQGRGEYCQSRTQSFETDVRKKAGSPQGRLQAVGHVPARPPPASPLARLSESLPRRRALPVIPMSEAGAQREGRALLASPPPPGLPVLRSPRTPRPAPTLPSKAVSRSFFPGGAWRILGGRDCRPTSLNPASRGGGLAP